MLFPTGIPNLNALSPSEQAELLQLLERYKELNARKDAQDHFLAFIRAVWPSFISGQHHKIMASAFERIASGELKRLSISMPPRFTKSEFAAIHLPAWFLGKYPDKKIIQCSHTADLAVGFGRKVRDLIDSAPYKAIFNNIHLKADSKAAGRWSTDQGAEYFAIGTGGAVAGKGADLLIIDDPISEQEATIAEYTPEVYDKVYDWYVSGPRQRLQPGAAIIIVMTRWGKRDLIGRVLEDQTKQDSGDKWEVIEFPAILPSGKSLWPEFWPLAELLRTKASIPLHRWNAQYLQQPTSSAGSLVPRGMWKRWEHERPPKCEAVISSWDTAFTKTERSNYSACTTWGVWMRKDEDSDKEIPALILLDAWRKKLAFPELKKEALSHYKDWEPDVMIIEGTAAGKPLIYELRAMGIPLQEFNPVRGNDKISRVNAITDIFASGNVWAPDMPWAEEVIEELNDFPAGAHDDFTDTVSQALLRFRQGGWIGSSLDEKDDLPKQRRPRSYY